MQKQTLDYRSQGTPSRGVVRTATVIVAGVVMLVNTALFLAAASDRSWGALAISVVIGPIANLVMMLVALSFAYSLKRLSLGANLLPYGLVSVLLPLLAIPADFFIIGSMGLHGC